jgi:hypothetical protein
MMNDIMTLTIMALDMQLKILANLDLKFNKTSKYNPKTHILFMDLHNLMVPNNHDHEKQKSIILMHIYFSVVNHLIIHTYIESCSKDVYNKQSITLYCPINSKCLKKFA